MTDSNPPQATPYLRRAFVYRLYPTSAKAEEAGRVVEFVNPAGTSKTCSACGSEFVNLSLRVRWVRCGCGLSLDRDHNAALNVLARSRLGRSRKALTWPGTACVALEAAGI